MSSKTNVSFGARLRRAQDLHTYVRGFVGYEPPREQEGVEQLGTLIAAIIASNNSAVELKQRYSEAVDARQKAFRESADSVQKIIGAIRRTVDAQYGNDSVPAHTIQNLIQKLKAAQASKTQGSAIPGIQAAGTVQTGGSRRDNSYAALTQIFNDVVSALGQFEGYKTSNEQLKLAALQQRSENLTRLNDQVVQQIQLLKIAQQNRSDQYEELKDRVRRVKAYVGAQYGLTSNENKLIKGLRI